MHTTTSSTAFAAVWIIIGDLTVIYDIAPTYRMVQLPLVAVPDHPLLTHQHIQLLRELHQAPLHLHCVPRGRRLRPVYIIVVYQWQLQCDNLSSARPVGRFIERSSVNIRRSKSM